MVVDLTPELRDPVDLLFETQLGGGTDINRAVAYCEPWVHEPRKTIMVLITDLYEGGDAHALRGRVNALVQSGVTVICLLALDDSGAPAYEHELASEFVTLGVPTFACTPDLFPSLIAAAISRQDITMWASRNDVKAGGRAANHAHAIVGPARPPPALKPSTRGAEREPSRDPTRSSHACPLVPVPPDPCLFPPVVPVPLSE